MSEEVWATYSVKDHFNPRALAADIMLFDRLVFPALRLRKSSTMRPLPVGARSSRVATRRSGNVGKTGIPMRKNRFLNCLPLSFARCHGTPRNQEAWRKEFAAKAEDHLPDYAFVASRSNAQPFSRLCERRWGILLRSLRGSKHRPRPGIHATMSPNGPDSLPSSSPSTCPISSNNASIAF
jgi:hypothetical protein